MNLMVNLGSFLPVTFPSGLQKINMSILTNSQNLEYLPNALAPDNYEKEIMPGDL